MKTSIRLASLGGARQAKVRAQADARAPGARGVQPQAAPHRRVRAVGADHQPAALDRAVDAQADGAPSSTIAPSTAAPSTASTPGVARAASNSARSRCSRRCPSATDGPSPLAGNSASALMPKPW